MRRALLLVACGVLALQPALAFKTYDVTLRMWRANVSERAAQSDGDSCMKLTSRTISFNSGWPSYSAGNYYRSGYDVNRPERVTAFVRCMEARNYHLNPNGYRVAEFRNVTPT